MWQWRLSVSGGWRFRWSAGGLRGNGWWRWFAEISSIGVRARFGNAFNAKYGSSSEC